jgi:acyl-coenzyme A synthetase/AMP-(fatty) acid ligase
VEVRFCDIDEKSKRIASGLIRLGFKKGDVLQFVTYETARLYLIQVAVWRIGGAVRGSFQDEAPGKLLFDKNDFLINLCHFLEEYARQMKETRARFILVEDGTLPKVKEAIKILDWTVSVLNFGKEKPDNGTSVDDLLKDDGSGT